MRAVASVIYFIFSLILAFIAVRFLFLLFGANPANQFVHFVYNVSDPLVSPFNGIFQSTTIPTGYINAHLDWASVVAFIVYGIVGSLIGYFIGPRRSV